MYKSSQKFSLQCNAENCQFIACSVIPLSDLIQFQKSQKYGKQNHQLPKEYMSSPIYCPLLCDWMWYSEWCTG